MTDEQIKEITIALIEKGLFATSNNNENTAKQIAKFVNTLRQEINKNYSGNSIKNKNYSDLAKSLVYKF